MDRQIALLLLCILAARRAHGVKTTCDAPSVVQNETATLTCHFSVDVTSTSPRYSFNIRRADHEDFDYHRDTVLDCDWVNTDLLCMTVKDGYQFNYDVSDQVTVMIPAATQEHAGQYVCQVVAFKQVAEIERCSLTVTHDTGKTEDPVPTSAISDSISLHTDTEIPVLKEGSVDVTVIVLPVLAFAFLAVALLAFLVLWRRRRSRSPNKDVEEQSSEHNPDLETDLPRDNDLPTDSSVDTDTPAEEAPLLSQSHPEDTSTQECWQAFSVESNETLPQHDHPHTSSQNATLNDDHDDIHDDIHDDNHDDIHDDIHDDNHDDEEELLRKKRDEFEPVLNEFKEELKTPNKLKEFQAFLFSADNGHQQ